MILGLFFLCLATPTQTQTPGVLVPACNNQTRSLQIPAGTTQTETDCAVWSITVLGVTFTSPASCPNSRTVRDEDTWSCGPAAEGIHCKARGYQVHVKQYALDNPCPGIPGTLPSTLEEANAAVQCKALPLTNEFNVWSATVTNCVTADPQQGFEEGVHAPRHDEIRSIGRDLYVVHHGSLDLFPAEPWEAALLDRFDPLRTLTPRDHPGALGATLVSHPALPGVGELQASVVFEFLDVPGYGTIRNEHRVAGTVLGSRRFALVDTGFVADEDGKRDLSVSQYRFDGRRFIHGERGAEYQNVFLASSGGAKEALQYDAQFVWPLLGWVQDPFWIPRMPGTTWESIARGDTVQVVERYAQVPGFGWSTYTIDVSSGRAQPVRIDGFDARGSLVVRRDFSDYRQLLPEVWRPMSVQESHFDARSGALTSRVTTRIDSARALGLREASELPEPEGFEDRWFVRLP